MIYVYSQVFDFQRYGYGVALAWIFFLIVLVLTLVLIFTTKYWVYYEVPQEGGRKRMSQAQALQTITVRPRSTPPHIVMRRIMSYVLLILITIVVIMPVVWLVLASLRKEDAWMAYPIVIIPRPAQWVNYVLSVAAQYKFFKLVGNTLQISPAEHHLDGGLERAGGLCLRASGGAREAVPVHPGALAADGAGYGHDDPELHAVLEDRADGYLLAMVPVGHLRQRLPHLPVSAVLLDDQQGPGGRGGGRWLQPIPHVLADLPAVVRAGDRDLGNRDYASGRCPQLVSVRSVAQTWFSQETYPA